VSAFVEQWRSNRMCKACSARGHIAVGAQTNPASGRGDPFEILAHGPRPNLAVPLSLSGFLFITVVISFGKNLIYFFTPSRVRAFVFY